MLRYMGQVFVSGSLGPAIGHIFAFIVSIIFGLLLLSAVNTAIVDLIAIQFLMSRDHEIPQTFQKLNKFGVPALGIVTAAIIPAFLVLLVKDMAGLADLYAIGVVGAIATNLGATSTDKNLRLEHWERYLMFATFLVMAAIELSLFYDKPHARVFAVTVLAVGLILRGLASERAAKGKATTARAPTTAFDRRGGERLPSTSEGDPLLCAVRSVGRTLDFAIEEAQETARPLYVVFVREQAIVTPEDR